MEILHRIVLPNLALPVEETLYVRLNERAFCELAAPCVRFESGGELRTDTFYGGLTVKAWKTTSPVEKLMLGVEGAGRFVLTLSLHRLGYTTQILSEETIALGADPLRVSVARWAELTDGMVFVQLRALEVGLIRSIYFCTDQPVTHDIQLGIVITHFNRLAQVQPAIERLHREVIEAAATRGRISLTVVDNSRNLADRSLSGVTVLANRNLGGSGGFARGLLALEGDQHTTHALFMDDDATCEAEAILRAFAVLSFAKSSTQAVAGALLNEAAPWQLLEKGARFDGKCRPLHAGRDLRRVDELLWAERHREPPEYGGWWFFAFALNAVKAYPFPFFVRGDDVFFSLQNRFDIVTLNGIACLSEDFSIKHGPMTAYLDSRYHLVHALMRERGTLRALRRLVSNHFVKPLCGYHYCSARAFALAIRHVSLGPSFFCADREMTQVRAEIASWTPAEVMRPLEHRDLKIRTPRRQRESRIRTLLRIVTLQGFLLPAGLLSKRLLVHAKGFYGQGKEVFGFQRVLYEHWPNETGYFAEYDRAQFFREICGLAGALLRLLWRLPRLRTQYRLAFPVMTSRTFWQRPDDSVVREAPGQLRGGVETCGMPDQQLQE